MNNAEIVWFNGKWGAGEPLIGPTDHAFWMASTIFDGARAMRGHLPDLKLHCERGIRSAITLGMEPKVGVAEMESLIREGLAQLPRETDYYLKLLFFCPGGFLQPDPATTAFALHLFEAPLPEDTGFSATFSEFRRPAASMAPTDAKACCLYPNSQRAMRDAIARGFEGAIMLDPDGCVAEFAIANLWIVRDGIALTPTPNGTFLNGITRQRLIRLLRDDGVTVREVRMLPKDVLEADEVFSTGNWGKVLHCSRIEDRVLPHGPVERRARELYLDFALNC